MILWLAHWELRPWQTPSCPYCMLLYCGNTWEPHLGVTGSISGADQSDYGYFGIFQIHQGKCQIRISFPTTVQISVHHLKSLCSIQEADYALGWSLTTGVPPLFLSFSIIYSPPNVGFTNPGTYSPNVHGSDAYRGSNRLWAKTLTETHGRPPWMHSQHYVRTTTRDNTEQNTDKG